MRRKINYLLLLFSILFTSCVSTDPAQGAMDPTALQVVPVASAPAQSASEQPAALPAASASPSIDAWLIIISEGYTSYLRAISAIGKPMVELGWADTRWEFFSASTNPDQPWFSRYDNEDNGLRIMNVHGDSAVELLSLLESGDLPEEKKAILQKEFTRDDQPAQTWSPDGTLLAYLDVPEGDRTRLMLYDTATKTSFRLSQASEDVIAPVWSPDGKWILYQTVDGFSAQGLPQILTMHAVNTNASEDRVLYQPASLRETVLGWSSPEIFAVQSMIERGNRDLRLVSLQDGSSLSLNAGLVKNAGWDAKTQTAMYLLTASETNNEQPSGVYAVTASTPQRMVLPGKWESLQYFKPSGIWIAGMEGELLIIHPDGTTGYIKGISSSRAVSPDGKFLVIDSNGSGSSLYSIDGTILASLLDKPVDRVTFTPDSQRVYFSSDSRLNMAAAPEWKIQPIPEGTNILGWVGF